MLYMFKWKFDENVVPEFQFDLEVSFIFFSKNCVCCSTWQWLILCSWWEDIVASHALHWRILDCFLNFAPVWFLPPLPCKPYKKCLQHQAVWNYLIHPGIKGTPSIHIKQIKKTLLRQAFVYYSTYVCSNGLHPSSWLRTFYYTLHHMVLKWCKV